MAGYMIVGIYDCPWFAKAGIIVDMLTKQDPSRKFTLESLHSRFEWEEYIEELQRSRGWQIKSWSPVTWEILMEPEGKGNLIGDIDDFCEYVNLVFGLVVHISTREIEDAVCKNKALSDHKGQQRLVRDSTVLNVSFVNTPLKILELVLTQLLSPYPITDPNTILNIKIFDKKSSPKELQGLLMEINDMASPVLYRVSTCFTAKQCFNDTHLVILGEEFSQGIEESPLEWLTRVEMSVMVYAEDISDVCNQHCKILVGCNGPQCFIAEIFRKKIPTYKVKEGCIAAIGQHVVNRAKGQIGRQVDVLSGRITRLHAWGWPGMTGAWVEVKDAVVMETNCMQGPTTLCRPLSEVAINSNWLYTEFSTEFLEEQRKMLASTKKMYPDISIAEAIVSTLHVWFESSRISQDMKVKCPTGCPSNPPESPVNPTVSLPALSVGIPCADNSGFPEGTFLVQPGMCFLERWLPIGKISEDTHQRIQKELSNLWTTRQELIYPEIRNYDPHNYEAEGEGHSSPFLHPVEHYGE